MPDAPASVVVDTNIVFSALLREHSRFSEVLLQSEHTFYVCESVLVELFRHKDRILRASRLEEADLARLYHVLLRRLQLYREDQIAPENWGRAYELCRDVDQTDTPHVALALELEGLLWTGDRTLRAGLEARGFTRFFAADPGS
ncbi:MAG TPA: PIN domain-containing protein [Longimicrobiaceae bacterium]|nr:PIN domain-containing protein [Longimicrobiaceae bacterium]